MKPVNIKKKYDIAYCIFVGVAFIVVIIWQIFHLPLPSWLLTDLPLTDSSFVILQIQVTIAVLPLAIIALITGMSKDTLYGVPVLKYVLRLRPVLLTYNSVAILQMFMIIIAFVSTSYQWYKVHLLEPTREEILAKNKPNENGTYSYIITNDLKGDFTEDELVTFIQNRFVNLKITCDFTYGFSSEQIGYGIIRQFPQD